MKKLSRANGDFFTLFAEVVWQIPFRDKTERDEQKQFSAGEAGEMKW